MCTEIPRLSTTVDASPPRGDTLAEIPTKDSSIFTRALVLVALAFAALPARRQP